MKTYFVCFFLYLLPFCSTAVNITVRLPQGTVEGQVNDDNVCSFFGIPYAKSELFAKPIPSNDWSHIYERTQAGIRCFDVPINGEAFPFNIEEHAPPFSDDCLFLNLFTPCKKTSDEHFPVMVFIHGGAFSWGSSFEYGSEGIRRLIVSKDVILITFNYRLGPWGFLRFDSRLPGNLGLWDQIELLKWIKANIRYFGGDSERITVFGHSAGAVSASLLSVSPASRDLFQNVILMSGEHESKWLPNETQLIDVSRRLIENFNCSNDVLACLRSTRSEDIRKFALQISSGTPSFAVNMADLELFPRSFKTLLQESPIKHVIMGFTRSETGLFHFPPVETMYSRMQIRDPSNYSMENFVALVEQSGGTIYEETLQKTTNSTAILEHVIKFTSEYFAIQPLFSEARLRTNAGQNVWLYSFDYFNQEDFAEDHPIKAHST